LAYAIIASVVVL